MGLNSNFRRGPAGHTSKWWSHLLAVWLLLDAASADPGQQPPPARYSDTCSTCLRASTTGRAAGAEDITQAQCNAFAKGATAALAPLAGNTSPFSLSCDSFSGSTQPKLRACAPLFITYALPLVSAFNASRYVTPALGRALGNALDGDGGNVRTFTLEYACPRGAKGSITRRIVVDPPRPTTRPSPSPSRIPDTCLLCLTSHASGQASSAGAATQQQCDSLASGVTQVFAPVLVSTASPPVKFWCSSFSGGGAQPTFSTCTMYHITGARLAVRGFNSSGASIASRLSAMLAEGLGSGIGTVHTFTLSADCNDGSGAASSTQRVVVGGKSPTGPGSTRTPSPKPTKAPPSPRPPLPCAWKDTCRLCLTASATGRSGSAGDVTQQQCDAFAEGVTPAFSPTLDSPVFSSGAFWCESYAGSAAAPTLQACTMQHVSTGGQAVQEFKDGTGDAVPKLSTLLAQALGGDGGAIRTFTLTLDCSTGDGRVLCNGRDPISTAMQRVVAEN